MIYKNRIIEQKLVSMLKNFPAVSITGPRQSGKTTMLRKVLHEYEYLSFDSPETRAFFEDDPKGFVAALGRKVVLDEVQKVPSIFEWIKIEIDADRIPGRFVLTGSAQFSMVHGISESLAGRCGYIKLLPFQCDEAVDSDWRDLELFGSYPELVMRNHAGNKDWYDAYIMTYLERDARSLLNIGNLRDFRNIINLLASRTAQELNFSSLSRELGVSEKTVASWVSVLEASYILFLLPSYHRNLGKRIVKRPKVYFYDTGLVSALTGLRSREVLEKGPLSGAIFENFVVAEVSKNIAHKGLDYGLYYFRSNDGIEADIVIEDNLNRRLIFGEVKRRMTIRPKDTRHIRTLAEAAEGHIDATWSTGASIIDSGNESTMLTGNTRRIGIGSKQLFTL